MAQCEMCSKDLPLIEVVVEGVDMNLCQGCKKFGTVKNKPRPPVAAAPRFKRPLRARPQIDKEQMEFVVPNAGELIKAAREKRGMRQIDLSRSLSISESEIHQVEAGHMRPTLAIARKFETGLGLKLVVTQKLDKVEEIHNSDDSVGGMTVADMIKIKKR